VEELVDVSVAVWHQPSRHRHIGRVCFGRQKINLNTVLAGQNVGPRCLGVRVPFL